MEHAITRVTIILKQLEEGDRRLYSNKSWKKILMERIQREADQGKAEIEQASNLASSQPV